MTTTQSQSAVDGTPAVDWYRLSGDEVMGRLETAPASGLTEPEAQSGSSGSRSKSGSGRFAPEGNRFGD